MNAPIRVLLVDDHAVVRAGYRSLLTNSGNIEIIGEATDAASAYRLFSTCAPDVVVMDISLPGSSGIAALERMLARDANARVLMFSMHEDAIFATRSLQAGARGYITKSSAPEILIEAVHAVAAGRSYTSSDMAQTLTMERYSDPESTLRTLTGREFEVLRLLLNGSTTEEMAATLHLSRKSIANHRWLIKQKTGVDNLMQLLPLALRVGLIADNAKRPPIG